MFEYCQIYKKRLISGFEYSSNLIDMKLILRTVALLLILAGAGAAFYYYNYGAPQSPRVEQIKNVRFKKITPPPGMKLTLQADAVVVNPNPFSLEISSLQADVYIDGNRTNEIAQNLSRTMPANEKFDLPLEFEIAIKDKTLLKDLSDFVTGAWKKRAITIKCEGTIFLKAANMDFGVPFQYEEEHKLSDYF